MKDRRQHERFAIALPAWIEVVTAEGRRKLDFLTRDVCAGGAFFQTDKTLPKGTQVRVDLAVPNERLKELTGAETLIRVTGKVARSDSTGMAICFDENYQILKL